MLGGGPWHKANLPATRWLENEHKFEIEVVKSVIEINNVNMIGAKRHHAQEPIKEKKNNRHVRHRKEDSIHVLPKSKPIVADQPSPGADKQKW